MLNPRATYNTTEAKASRAWWIAFALGILVFGVITIVAIIMVWHDKKLLKQMGLAIFYMNLPFVAGVLALGVSTITGIQDLAGFGFVLILLGGVAVPFGFGIAAYAQRKIDMAQPRLDAEDAARKSDIKATHDAAGSSCAHEGCNRGRTSPYMVCIDHLCSGCASGRDPCGLCLKGE